MTGETPGGAALGERAASLFLVVTLATFYAASSVPTPLYRLYQEAFAFSPIMITVIYSVYSFSLLTSLLTVGSISDHLGRRPVIFASLLLLLLTIALFLMAKSVAWLIAARIVQGAATGAAASSLGAAILDLDPVRGAVANSIAPLAGMAVGALATSALVQYAPDPLHLVYFATFAIVTVQAAGVWWVPETARRRPGVLAALKPVITVPPRVRGPLLRVMPLSIAVWTLAGFYLSLVPSLVKVATGDTAPLVGGAVVGALTASGSLTVFFLRRGGPTVALRIGVPAILLGIAAVLIGTHRANPSILIVATLIAGVGFGAIFLGTVRMIMPLAAPEERAGLLSSFYVICYLAASLPAIAAGFLARSLGLVAAADIYGTAVIVLSLAGAAAVGARRSQRV